MVEPALDFAAMELSKCGGGGTQYVLPKPASQLVDEGVLKELVMP